MWKIGFKFGSVYRRRGLKGPGFAESKEGRGVGGTEKKKDYTTAMAIVRVAKGGCKEKASEVGGRKVTATRCRSSRDGRREWR